MAMCCELATQKGGPKKKLCYDSLLYELIKHMKL